MSDQITAEQRKTLWTRFHDLWGAAKEQRYDKPGWIDLQAQVETLLAQLDADQQRIAAWHDRFRAIVGADEPDSAGNAVLTLQQRIAELERVANEQSTYHTLWKGKCEDMQARVTALEQARRTLVEALRRIHSAWLGVLRGRNHYNPDHNTFEHLDDCTLDHSVRSALAAAEQETPTR